MKKLLFALFCLAAIFTGCQKDAGINANITGSDLSSINGQLKGTWVFPVETFSIVDSAGKALQPGENLSVPAFQFDGGMKVNIMPDPHTIQKGTYSISASNGFIYLDIVNPDKTIKEYQLLLVNAHTLKLSNSQPYVYYDSSNTPVVANAVYTCQFTKQTAADITGSLVKVTTSSDSAYNIRISAGHPDASVTMVDSVGNVTGAYSFAYVAKHNDHVIVDMVGSTGKAHFYAYYNGLPLAGQMQTEPNELKTSTGWIIP